MKRAVFWVVLLPVLVPGLVLGQAGASAPTGETPGAFVDRIQGLLRSGNLPAYLQVFAPDIRTAEESRVRTYFDDLRMTEVSLHPAGVRSVENGATRIFLQAFFENAYAAVIESWTMTLEEREAAWSVVGLDVTGNMTRLYKVRIPSERAERVRRLEVTHADVRFTFTDAAIFYDNIPDLETAMVVVGHGRVDFSPSNANEKHQLELLYKKNRLEDDVDSLYIRGSSSFFASNLKVDRADGLPAVSADERARAGAVFARNYPRSFTIESSLDKDLLSFLPQGDETVLEFRARKAGELVYVFYPFSDDEISLYDHGKDRLICLYSPDEGPGPPQKRMFISFGQKFDISSYGLDLSYAPESHYLSAKARIEVIPKVTPLDSLKFRFNPDLEILKITDEEGRELFYTQDRLREFLYVYFISPPAVKTTTAIEVFYRGRMSPAAPTTDVIGQAGRTRQIRFKPIYDTRFFSHAGFWYPGPAEEDYFLTRLTLIIPPEWKCVANGEMVAQGRREDMDDVVAIEKAGSSVFTFVSRSPVKYMSFIVAKFDRPSERAGPVPIAFYVSSEVLASRPAMVDQAADILDFYGRTFGPYPYEKLGIVLRLWPTSGGHSPASFIVINEIPWVSDSEFVSMPADTPVDLSTWEEYFLAHEIAHQWWGQGVSFDSYKDQWLSEGLAQFSAASYLRRKYGESAFAAILKKFARWTERKSFRGPIVMGSRLSYYDFEAYQSIVYNKAALALFMLQDVVGREAFEAGLRSFFEKHEFRAARTGDFIAAMESASGLDLKEFFTGWFSSWELPEVQTTWTETSVAEGVRLDFRVRQLKGQFTFPLWIAWSHGGEAGRTKVVVDEMTEEFSLTLPRRPDKVRVNPDKAVPGKFF